MKSAYYPIFAAQPKYALNALSNLMLCYRYFKEIRDCQMHGGGLGSSTAQNAFNMFQPVSSVTSLGINGPLLFEPVVEGQPVKLHLRGVVGFCDVLSRIIVTLDAEFSRSVLAEPYFIKMLKGSLRGKSSLLSGEPKRRTKQIEKLCRGAGLPTPKDPNRIFLFLKSHRLVNG